LIDKSRAGRYRRIKEQLSELIQGKSPNLIAAMSTICAVLHAKMPHHSWTGFYMVAAKDELHVGPYQGPAACQVLKGRGVCLHCVRNGKPVVVEDVDEFPGHIACDSSAKSEIVLPIFKENEVAAVLDIDSNRIAQFDEGDIAPLESILELLTPYL